MGGTLVYGGVVYGKMPIHDLEDAGIGRGTDGG